VGLLGTVCSIALGALASAALRPGDMAVRHVFVGAAIAATSIGITARVLRDLHKTDTREARVILSAAVLDDVLGLVVLSALTGWIAAAEGGTQPVAWVSVGWIVVKALGFFAVALAVGMPLTPWLFAAAARLRTPGAQVAAGLSFCFVLAWAAGVLGLAPLVGAFTAGLILEEGHSASFAARGEPTLARLVEPVSSFLVPVFFVLMGARVSLSALAHPGSLAVAGVLLLAAVLGKLACALGARGTRRLAVAAGMMPRGEVTLIYASLGKPLLDEPMYAALVLVILATTVATPPALKWALRAREPREQREQR
jgi:Kef-type K+ transport system membrane component KefB